MLYSKKPRKMPANGLRLKQINIPLNSVFIDHGHRLALEGKGYMTPGTVFTLSQCQKF